MIHIREAIVVEGRYDVNKIRQLVDTVVIETGGFAIFNNKEKLALIRRIAAERGILVLTDSDGAGFVIRRYLRGAIDPARVKHAYIPDIPGKERRKSRPGREGKLGVEGMSREIILDALKKAGATIEGENTPQPRGITKQDMMALGLSGGPDAGAKRLALQKKLDLPEHMSANALLEALNLICSLEELQQLLGQTECESSFGETSW